MTYEEFLALGPDRLDGLSTALAALALDRAGNWEAAHERVNDGEEPETRRVHAYLHRKEGDLANARYWYNRVGEPEPSLSLDEEWETLVQRFL